MKTDHVSGACLCGAVKVSFNLAKESFDVCHCGMCRKWGGGPAFTVDGGSDVEFQGAENIATYQSSEWAERGFCKHCGTHLFYHVKATGFRNYPLGLIENVDNLSFDLEIFIDQKPDYYKFANQTHKLTEAEVFAKYLSS